MRKMSSVIVVNHENEFDEETRLNAPKYTLGYTRWYNRKVIHVSNTYYTRIIILHASLIHHLLYPRLFI